MLRKQSSSDSIIYIIYIIYKQKSNKWFSRSHYNTKDWLKDNQILEYTFQWSDKHDLSLLKTVNDVLKRVCGSQKYSLKLSYRTISDSIQNYNNRILVKKIILCI